MKKKTVIIGASTNPARYSYIASGMLSEYGHDIVPVGIKRGSLFGKEILDLRTRPSVSDVDTITLYIGPHHQHEWIDYIIGLKPKRIIFNPGTENLEFAQRAEKAGIEAQEACTLVMLRSNQF